MPVGQHSSGWWNDKCSRTVYGTGLAPISLSRVCQGVCVETVVKRGNIAMKKTNRSMALAVAGVAALLAGRAVWRRLVAYSFREKVILITGGSRGFGLVLARELVKEGAKIVLCARAQEELDQAEAEFHRQGVEVLAIPCDVAQQDQVERMVGEVIARWGRIDVLINNAGVIQTGPIEEMTIRDFQEAMNIHFWGSLHTTQAVLPSMRARRDGRIVNITSIGGKISVPHLVPYCASKFALVGLSQGLRAELAKDGVVVTTVCPGLMRTGSPRNAKFKGQHRAEYAWFSISDSLPLLSISAESAARKVIDACRYGEAELIYTLPAQVGAAFHGVFPGLTADLLGWVNRFLPGPGGIGTRAVKGKKSYSRWSPSFLTVLSDRAAARNNEV